MPFPRTWVEELITEWLCVEGFLVESNVPAGSAKTSRGGGGRFEADVIGVRVSNEYSSAKLVIRHFETGQLIANPEKNCQRVQRKFAQGICEAMETRFRGLTGFQGSSVAYERWLVADTSQGTKTLIAGRMPNVQVLGVVDFVMGPVLKTLKQREKGRTLPSNFWLLGFLEHLRLWTALNPQIVKGDEALRGQAEGQAEGS